MVKHHGPTIKDDKKYEELRKQGYSKQKSARIANASSKRNVGKKDGKNSKYEKLKKVELIKKAKKIGMKNYSKMNKKELIKRLRKEE